MPKEKDDDNSVVERWKDDTIIFLLTGRDFDEMEKVSQIKDNCFISRDNAFTNVWNYF